MQKIAYPEECLTHLDLAPELGRLILAARAQGLDFVGYLLGIAELSLIETRAMRDYLEGREPESPRNTSAR